MMVNRITVAPSILSANPLRLFDEITEAESAGAGAHHIEFRIS